MLSEGNGSQLRFSLEESVWFQKGQEVAELVSISLDPHITIREEDQYVIIEGDLSLSGEYKRNNEEAAEEEEILSPKFVQFVEERDGICEFNHRFPVDITIPNNRIRTLDDIQVEIDSFDYSFPEKSCLKLTADLMISGLYGDEPQVEKVEKEIEVVHLRQDESKVEQEEEIETIYTPFEAEARKQPDQEQVEVELVKEERTEPTEILIDEPVQEENKQSEKEMEISFSASRMAESEVETDEEVEEAENEASSSDEKTKQKKKKSKKQGMSIAEFLARKEDEEVAKLKVCIVQNGDTLDLLAERYDVSVHQILKMNHLELNQEIEEGQVLYIPEPVSQQ